MGHMRVCLRALHIVWALNSIAWYNRLRLWGKSLGLYIYFLGFTDDAKEIDQIHSAMMAAVLSSIYDYETDWVAVPNSEHSLFQKLLQEHVSNECARQMALSLFQSDLKGDIDEDGLERGAIALRFYKIVIKSRWLNQYSLAEINEFGRQLQRVDDLLDFSADLKAGDRNCFSAVRQYDHLLSVEQFLGSNFFACLQKHSRMYVLLKFRCQKIISDLRGETPSIGELIDTCRPFAMVYAAVVTILGFHIVGRVGVLAITAAAALNGITGSIMTINDIVDREHDRKKGKHIAANHPWALCQFWMQLNALTVVLLLLTAWQSTVVARCAIAIWIVGLAYSLPRVRQWYLIQTILVAVCSAAPLLLGCVYYGCSSLSVYMLTAALLTIIFMREIMKDIEDENCDRGYKETVATRLGPIKAGMLLITLCIVPACILGLHPVNAVRLSAFSVAVIQGANGLLLLHPHRAKLAQASIDGVIAGITVIALFAA